VWIVLATVLSTISISKPKDEHGQEITPEIAFDIGLNAYVVFAPCARMNFLTVVFLFSSLGHMVIAANPSHSSV
jgi:hypothetical protein